MVISIHTLNSNPMKSCMNSFIHEPNLILVKSSVVESNDNLHINLKKGHAALSIHTLNRTCSGSRTI